MSADENDLKKIVSFAKIQKTLLGSGNIQPSIFELKNKNLFRKGIYFSKDLFKNHKIGIKDIMFARPETKINILNYKKIIGKRLNKNKEKFQEVDTKDLR